MIHDHTAQEQRIESLETSMRKVANVLEKLGQGIRHQGGDDNVASLLITTAHEIETKLDPN